MGGTSRKHTKPLRLGRRSHVSRLPSREQSTQQTEKRADEQRAILLPRSQLDRGAGIQGFKIAKESGAYSVLLFLAEFLESGIGAQRIPDWVEPKKGGSNDNWRNPHPAFIRGL